MTDTDLILAAANAARHAYAPYSGFPVGAALLTADNRVFTGVNIENASYGLTICAERNALAAAIATGARDFSAIAIATNGAAAVPPCGACRQVLAEFCSPTFRIITASIYPPETLNVFSLEALLPSAFNATLLNTSIKESPCDRQET